jgi:hypothetical protein
MAQHADTEPTMEEIVVALRETHRDAGRSMPTQLLSRRSEGKSKPPNIITYPQNARAGQTAAADLRDSEIDRLLTENARLNERVVFLLKIIEREQAQSAELAALAMEREAMFRHVKAALKAELRPPLLVLLRMLEKQVADPNRLATEDAPSAWIVDLISKLESDHPGEAPGDPLLLLQPRLTLRQRWSRFFHELGF